MRRSQVWTSSPWLGPGSAPFTASFAHVGALKGARLCTRGWSVAHVRETFRPSSERMAAVRVTTRLEPVLASGMGGLAHPRSRSDPTAPDGAPRVPGGRAGAWVARWRPGAMTRSQAQLERHDLRSGRGGGGESRVCAMQRMLCVMFICYAGPQVTSLPAASLGTRPRFGPSSLKHALAQRARCFASAFAPSVLKEIC